MTHYGITGLLQFLFCAIFRVRACAFFFVRDDSRAEQVDRLPVRTPLVSLKTRAQVPFALARAACAYAPVEPGQADDQPDDLKL
jgi:hypothetical protein